jgi:putative spermidine/putrescine transport system substrate-binding protein
MRNKPSNGRVLVLLSIMGLALAACGIGDPDADAGTGAQPATGDQEDGGRLAVAVYGGPITDNWDKTFGAEFREQFPNVELTVAGVPNPSSLLHTQEGNVQFDLMLATASDVAQLASGPADRYGSVEPADLGRADAVYDEYVVEDGDGGWVATPVALTYYAIAVNKNVHDPASITSWADLADPEFQGRYLMNSPSFFSTTDLPMFALANGGSFTNLEPGMELLEQALPNVRGVATDLANTAAQMQNESITVSGFFFSQYSSLLDSGVPVEFVVPEEGALGSPLYLVLSPESENVTNARNFLDIVLSKEMQEAAQEPTSYVPVVRDAELSERLVERSGFEDVDSLMASLAFPDYLHLAENRDANTSRIEDLLATN